MSRRLRRTVWNWRWWVLLPVLPVLLVLAVVAACMRVTAETLDEVAGYATPLVRWMQGGAK